MCWNDKVRTVESGKGSSALRLGSDSRCVVAAPWKGLTGGRRTRNGAAAIPKLSLRRAASESADSENGDGGGAAELTAAVMTMGMGLSVGCDRLIAYSKNQCCMSGMQLKVLHDVCIVGGNVVLTLAQLATYTAPSASAGTAECQSGLLKLNAHKTATLTSDRSTGESSGGDSAPRMRSCVLRLVRGGLPLLLLPALPPLSRRRLRLPPSLSEALDVSEAVRSRLVVPELICTAAVFFRCTGVSLVLPAAQQGIGVSA